MKQILMIGKFNSVFEDIAAILKLKYHLQMSVDNLDMVKGLLKIDKPDAVVFCLAGLAMDGRKIMTELLYHHTDMPVICIGSWTDKSICREFFQHDMFSWVNKDTMDEELLPTMSRMLNMASVKTPKQSRGERKTILLVDDNPIFLRSMNAVLSPNYDVMLANSGTKAMTMVGQKVPDMVFLDCEMPVCDGKMTYKMFKDLDEMKDVPIVFLTGVNDASYIQDALKLQPAGYLLKPASKERIISTIQRVLGEETDGRA